MFVSVCLCRVCRGGLLVSLGRGRSGVDMSEDTHGRALGIFLPNSATRHGGHGALCRRQPRCQARQSRAARAALPALHRSAGSAGSECPYTGPATAPAPHQDTRVEPVLVRRNRAWADQSGAVRAFACLAATPCPLPPPRLHCPRPPVGLLRRPVIEAATPGHAGACWMPCLTRGHSA